MCLLKFNWIYCCLALPCHFLLFRSNYVYSPQFTYQFYIMHHKNQYEIKLFIIFELNWIELNWTRLLISFIPSDANDSSKDSLGSFIKFTYLCVLASFSFSFTKRTELTRSGQGLCQKKASDWTEHMLSRHTSREWMPS